MRYHKIDRTFLFTVIALVVIGFFIFSSASLGLLARGGVRFSSVAFSQIFLGIFLGSAALLFMTRLNYRVLKKYSLLIFIVSMAATLLVFIPSIGVEYNGATRWISIFGLSVQPAEFLKLGFVIYFAAWLSGIRDKLHTFSYGVIPFSTRDIVSSFFRVAATLNGSGDLSRPVKTYLKGHNTEPLPSSEA